MSTPAHIYFLQPQSCWAQPVTRLAVILPVWLKNKGQFLAKPLVRPKTLSDRFDSLAHGACSLKWGRGVGGGVGCVAALFLCLVQQRCPMRDIHMMCSTWGQDSYSFSQFGESALVEENISEGHSELKIASYHLTLDTCLDIWKVEHSISTVQFVTYRSNILWTARNLKQKVW